VSITPIFTGVSHISLLLAVLDLTTCFMTVYILKLTRTVQVMDSNSECQLILLLSETLVQTTEAFSIFGLCLD
jgi:hypothetical protein